MGSILSKFREDNSTNEQENFMRLLILLLNTSTRCVRKVFDKEIHPEKLQEELGKIRCFLNASRLIDRRQQQILYPPRGEPDPTSKSFDLTLMCLLLRHLARKKCISDTFPVESDHSQEADLSRLKWYRNEIVHNPNFKIETKTFERYSKDIMQVNGRLGGCEMIELCKEIISGTLEFRLNDVKSLLLQLFYILHNKGCDLSRKVSEKFWFFHPIYQLRIVFSFLKSHFWIFPTMYIIWDEYQDSYHDENSFQKTECQEHGYFSKYTDLLKSFSPMHVATPIGESHVFEIVCKNCPFLSKWDCKITADQTPINIIKMVCSCKKKSVKGELCYITLFDQLDLRLYMHDTEMSFHNNQFILTNKDCIHKNEGATNDGKTYEADIREKVLFTKNPRVSGEEQDEKMFLCQQTTPLQRLVAEEGSFVMGYFNVSVLHRNHLPGYQTGYNSGLCETVCLDQNLLN